MVEEVMVIFKPVLKDDKMRSLNEIEQMAHDLIRSGNISADSIEELVTREKMVLHEVSLLENAVKNAITNDFALAKTRYGIKLQKHFQKNLHEKGSTN